MKKFTIHMRLSRESKAGTHASLLGFSEKEGQVALVFVVVMRAQCICDSQGLQSLNFPSGAKRKCLGFLISLSRSGQIEGESLKAVSRQTSNMEGLYSSSPSPGVAAA